ncbi:WhiB family transcriptional regulator [Nonomuraea endophytica]|uniref:4Fe-4S Wbl-type domain-containing protein n=1 Tax=Nonomuraea endophytica TaxID=714136 RepID=A0A7W8A827_9ACTN|nr:WhiB family transcriptional regulator [Nonomuraea endophytica]MBB5081332.1 hypothetical protein [Nonomuraea endophytica]
MIRTLLGDVPDFHARAACGGKATVMSSRDDSGIAQAKAICARCPVLNDCRAWAGELREEKDPEMVLGGLTWLERRQGVPSGERRCNTCQQVKSFTEFGRRSKGKGGRQSICLDCSRQQSKAAYDRRVQQKRDAHKNSQATS